MPFLTASLVTLSLTEDKCVPQPCLTNPGYFQSLKMLQTPQSQHPVPKPWFLNTVSTKRSQGPRLLGEMTDSRAGIGNLKMGLG